MFTTPSRLRVACAPLLLVAACTRTTDPPNPSQTVTISPESAPTPASPTSENKDVSPAMTNPKEIESDGPLEAGHVTFEGMVRPTKGGYEVRGVIVSDEVLPKALERAPGRDAKNADWFLGAIVRITGQLRKQESPPPSKDGLAVQTRSGTWFELERFETASLVKPAEVIEGTLGRSKGLFTVAGRLISAEDVAWSLGPKGAESGDEVRFFGQAHTVVCEPNTQCLISGSLPLFDVGRAERLR